MRTFPLRDKARLQTERIAEAIGKCEAEIVTLQAAQEEQDQAGKTSAALQYLGGSTVEAPRDITPQIKALQAARAGLQTELESAKIAEDKALLQDLREQAAVIKAETDPLVQRVLEIKAELKTAVARLRWLDQEGHLIHQTWGRACKSQKTPPPPRPAIGVIPRGLLND